MDSRSSSLGREVASTSYPSVPAKLGGYRKCRTWSGGKISGRRPALPTYERLTCIRATLERETPTRVDSRQDADAAPNTEVVGALVERAAEADGYLPLSEAQEIISEVVGAARPAPPKLLTFCKSGEEELRLLNYSVNGALVGLSIFLAASQLGTPGTVSGLSGLTALKAVAQQGRDLYGYFVDAHPLLTKAAISGTVYGLGDLTAQTYEGRSWQEFDPLRILRSSLCGFVAHGPLSHLFYEKMDRFFVLSKYFDGGDAWFTPLAKIAVDQTLFAATWNSLYYVMLGAMKLESPDIILKTVKSSWWELLKAGWRVWPIVHVMTYTLIPCRDRVLWVDMVELVWVTVLSVYGQQRRERAGAAACALPGVAGEGGVFTEDILRGMTVESQITFQTAEGEPVIRRLDEVLVEAALLEANFATSLDKATRYTKPASSDRPADPPGT